MAAMLILAGLLFLLLSWAWIIIRAFMYKPFWGLAVVLPPVLVVFVLLHGRRIALPLVTLTASLVILGSGGYQLATEQPERWQKIVTWQGLGLFGKQDSPLAAEHIQGKLFGERFVARSAELDGQLLILRENSTDGLGAEIKIQLLTQPDLSAHSGLFLDVLPDDVHAVPRIEINWYSYELGLRQKKQITGDYTLRLALASQPPNLLLGDFYLSLAKAQHTTIAGLLEVKSNKLRYQGRQVDLSYDHPETIDYLIEQHSRAVLEKELLLFKRTTEIEVFSVPLTIAGELSVDGRRIPAQFVLSKQSDWHIVESSLTAIAQQLSRQAAINTPTHPSATFSLTHLLDHKAQYVNQEMHVETNIGYKFAGRFQGLNAEGGLVFQRIMDKGGEVTLQLQPGEVRHIRLRAE